MFNEENKYVEAAKDIILDQIDKKNITVFLFGSRATGKGKRDSDLDIGLWSNNKIESTIMRKIRSAIEESIVPYHVDVVDFTTVEEKFKKIALRKIIIWNRGKDFNLN